MTIRVGLVGTGYVSKVRAETLLADGRSHLSTVAGREKSRTAEFASRYGLTATESWQHLVQDSAIDLVVVATVSSLHGDVVEAALRAGKHVVVEYPLSLNVEQAKRLLALSVQSGLLLHVEHVELLGGLHREMRSHLSQVGTPSYVNYRTIMPKHPAPMKWTYRSDLFGFPFCGALSRVHRLTNLFGQVSAVDCWAKTWERAAYPPFYSSILCSARLHFESGLTADLTYAKGEQFWQARRDMEVQGSLGALTFVGNEGVLATAGGLQQVKAAPRKSLLKADTQEVLAYLTNGEPMYVKAAESVYALAVGDALRQSSEQGRSVVLDGFSLDGDP
ncbi:MAG: Gfo/Idh/MocA family oxidoreductase [Cyanobacteria bacterium J06560_2]